MKRSSGATMSIKAYPRLSESQELFQRGLNDDASMKLIEHLRENKDDPRGLALLGEIALNSGALVQSERFLRIAMRDGAQPLAAGGHVARAAGAG